jgi:hypothetical protein
VLVAASAMLALTVSPASAAPAQHRGWFQTTDPVADGRVHRNNDIIQVRVGNAPIVRLRLNTRVGADPATSPAWRNPTGATRIVWSLDTDGDPGVEYRVVMASSAEGPATPVVIETATGAEPCFPQFTFGNRNHHVMAFAWDCIGSPGRLRAKVQYRFVPPGGGPLVDAAPNGRRYTPEVLYPIPI